MSPPSENLTNVLSNKNHHFFNFMNKLLIVTISCYIREETIVSELLILIHLSAVNDLTKCDSILM